MIFTNDEEFFKNMGCKDMIKWANESIKFVIEKLGYKKEQILHYHTIININLLYKIKPLLI